MWTALTVACLFVIAWLAYYELCAWLHRRAKRRADYLTKHIREEASKENPMDRGSWDERGLDQKGNPWDGIVK